MRLRRSLLPSVIEAGVRSHLANGAIMCAAGIAARLDPNGCRDISRRDVLAWLCDHPELVTCTDDGWMLRQGVHA